MASARENSNFSSSILHYERFRSEGVQGSFGSNVPDFPNTLWRRRLFPWVFFRIGVDRSNDLRYPRTVSGINADRSEEIL